MSYSSRNRDPRNYFRNFIRCGNLSCKKSCDENYLECDICMKRYHYKCKKVTLTAYLSIINSNSTYVCSDNCFRSIFPFHDLKDNEFLTTFINDKNEFPCKKCKLECLGGELMNCIQCDICDAWLHADCAKLEFDFQSYVEGKHDFICGKNCKDRSFTSVFPFYKIGFSKIDEFHPFRDNSLCKNCRNDCVSDCIQCDECSYWLHYNCAGLTKEQFEQFGNELRHTDFFCSKRCEIRSLPFSSFSDFIINPDDGPNDCSAVIQNNILAIPGTIDITSDNPVSSAVYNKGRKNTLSLDDKIKKAKSSKSVYFDKFLEIECSYLNPNNLNDQILFRDNSEFVAFHNNVRSMNANFDKVHDIFKNCSRKPDIMAFSDTQIRKTSIQPKTPNGYHEFVFTESPTKAGGVGFYLLETLDYKLCPDLSLNLDLCEDIWLEIENVNSPKLNNRGLIVGIVYRHGHNLKHFYETLSERLIILNQKKLKYLIVGDFNVDLMKYNLTGGITDYLDAIHSTGCTAFIDKPTRIISSAATCIDHVYSNMHTECLENYITLSSVSDHFGTLTKIKGVSKEIDKKDLYFRKTKLSDEKWEQFSLECQNSLKENVPFPHLLNANSLAESITNTYQGVIDKFMPLKRKPFKKLKEEPDRPWLTPGLKVSIKTMFELLHHSKLTRSADDYKKYKTYHSI